MPKVAEGFESYIHALLGLEALAVACRAEMAEHARRVQDSQAEGDLLKQRLSAVFGAAVSGGKSWFLEGSDSVDVVTEIQTYRQKVARFLNVGAEIQDQVRLVRSCLLDVDRHFEAGREWAVLAETTLATWEHIDVSEYSCDRALEGLNSYSEALAKVVRLHGALISAHHGFASASQRTSKLEGTIRSMLSKRPFRLPEMEVWAAGATSLLEEKGSIVGSTEAMERYCARLLSAVEQRREIVRTFREQVAKLQSDLVAAQEGWQATYEETRTVAREPSGEEVGIGQVIVPVGVLFGGAFGALFGTWIGGNTGALSGCFVGAVVLAALMWSLAFKLRRRGMHKAADRLGQFTLACRTAEAKIRDLAALDPSDAALDEVVCAPPESGGTVQRS